VDADDEDVDADDALGDVRDRRRSLAHPAHHGPQLGGARGAHAGGPAVSYVESLMARCPPGTIRVYGGCLTARESNNTSVLMNGADAKHQPAPAGHNKGPTFQANADELIRVGRVVTSFRRIGLAIRDKRCQRHHLIVLYAMMERLNERSGTAFPSRQIIGKQEGLSDKTVENVLYDLRNWGHIDWERRADANASAERALRRASEMAAEVIIHRKANAPVVVDMGGGFGQDVANRLRENGTSFQAYNGSNASTFIGKGGIRFVNRRAEAWWALRTALDPETEGGSVIALPDDPELLADLTAPAQSELPSW
jgi:hypothetical protein